MANTKSALSGAASGAAAGSAFGPWGAAIGGGIGLLGGLMDSGGGSYVGGLPTAAFESWDVQRYLPPSLRFDYDTLGQGRTVTGTGTQEAVAGGLQNIYGLMQNPGGLNPNVAAAIAPRLAVESERIGQNYRGIAANQAGAAARTNAPVSIKNALASALDVSQERAQRDTRRDALFESEQLRRQDMDQTYRLLGLILDYINSAKGTASTAQLNAQNMSAQNKNAAISSLGQLGGNLALQYGRQQAPTGQPGSFQQNFPASGEFPSGWGG